MRFSVTCNHKFILALGKQIIKQNEELVGVIDSIYQANKGLNTTEQTSTTDEKYLKIRQDIHTTIAQLKGIKVT